MCGRFAQYHQTRYYAERLGVPIDRQLGDLAPRYNIAPTEAPLVARLEAPGKEIDLLPTRWGFIPHWAQADYDGPHPINARAETVATTAMFRAAFRDHRCLVPADGYFEWSGPRGNKQPFYFQLRSGEPMFFAGIWARRKLPGQSEDLTFAIIIGPANELTAEVHDRMPIILPPARGNQWLNPAEHGIEALQRMLLPYPAQEMACFPVSRAVNDPRHKDADCIAPIEAPQP